MQLALYKSQHPEDADRLAEKLDDLLSDYQVYQQNVQSLRWNRRLRPFLDLGPKVQLLQQVTQQNQEHVAELLLEMGYSPSEPSSETALALSNHRVQLLQPVENGNDALEALIQSTHELLETIQEVWYLAQEVEEPHTLRLMTHLSAQLRFGMQVFYASRSALNN